MTRAFVSRRFRSASRIVFVWCFAVFVISVIALRVEAAIYASRIVSVVTALSTLRLGETSKAETMRRIPALQPSKTRNQGIPYCDADECLSGSVGNGLSGRLLWRMWRSQSDFLSDVLRWWGFRMEFLDVNVKFKSEKVSGFDYSLWVSAPGVPESIPYPPPDAELGMVVIGVSSLDVINRSVPNSNVQDHPPYVLLVKTSQSIGIALTPGAPKEIERATSDLRLDCVWSFGGCRRWNQLLPAVQPLLRR
jgi:hypothetical protein